MDDWELLRDYCRGSEPAFAELVRRHLNAVYSTALRRVNHPETAHDVCQRVFSLLAQKASTLQSTGSLLGWLHRAAVHVSSEILRTERRRHAREQEVSHLNAAMTSDTGSDDVWQQLAPQLDTALLQLSEVDRQALLLRFFERLPLAEVGRRLGTSEAAAKMRVGRAVTRLRERLGLNGVVLTGVMLVGLLSERTVVAAPAGFADGILAAALSKAGTVATFGSGLATLSKLALPLAGFATAVVLGTVGLHSFRNSGTVVSPVQELASSSSGSSSAVQKGREEVAIDPLEDPANLEQAIARLREAIRTPFKRKIPTDQVQEAVNALGRHAPKALPMVLEELTAAMDLKASKSKTEFDQMYQIQILARETLRSMGRFAHDAIPQVLEWYREGKLAGINHGLPTLLIALEPTFDQSRELIEHIAQTSRPTSTSIPETVLQLTELHPELLPETLQLLGDRLSQSEGDHVLVLARTLAKLPGSNPEKLRPVFEQFLMLPELRDPTHYQAKFENGTHEVWRITQRGFDDAKRYQAAAALTSLGEAGRESLPALAELAQRTTNEQLLDQVFRSIAELDPERKFETPELTAARKGWDQDQAFFDKLKFGTADLEDLRQGLTRSRSAGAAASVLAQRGDEARELAPELVAALTRTGSSEVAQALKTLAPEQLVQCLKNPAAFTLVKTYEFHARSEQQALVEAAQALAELGPQASFALPALKDALEIPDRDGLRLTLDKTIRAIDPQAPQLVFHGNSISALSSALIAARDAAESAGNPDQARLATNTSIRLEPNNGMTRSELLAIDAELQAADPALHRIYREALVLAIPQLQPAQVASP